MQAAGSTGAGDIYIRGGQFLMARRRAIAASTTGTNASATRATCGSTSTDARLAGGSQIRTAPRRQRPGRPRRADRDGRRDHRGAVPGTGGGGPGWWRRRWRRWRRRRRRRRERTASGLLSNVAAGASGAGGELVITANRIHDSRRRSARGDDGRRRRRGRHQCCDAAERLTVTQEAQVNANTSGGRPGGDIRLDAPTVEVLNGSRVGSVAQSAGPGGSITIVAPTALIVTGTNGDAESREQSRLAHHREQLFHGHRRRRLDRGRSRARSSSTTARVSRRARRASATAAPCKSSRPAAITLVGARGDGRARRSKPRRRSRPRKRVRSTGPRIGHAGDISIRAPSLTLADGAEIVGNTSPARQRRRDQHRGRPPRDRERADRERVDGYGTPAPAAGDSCDVRRASSRWPSRTLSESRLTTIDGTGGADRARAPTRIQPRRRLVEVSAATTGSRQRWRRRARRRPPSSSRTAHVVSASSSA